MSDNAITVVGNLTQSPDLKFLNNGTPSIRFSVAVNRRWMNRQTQEWEERVSFFEVVTYGTLAENVANSLTKGTRVMVGGRLEQRSWVTDDGERRSVTEITADEIAPSLRFATVVVTKTPRGTVAAEPHPAGRPQRVAEPVPTGVEFDEEPF